MNIFRVNRLPFFQAPDAAPGAIDSPVPPVDPALSADPPASDPPVAPELQPDPPAPDAGRQDGRKNPWYLRRIADETERARIAEARAADAEALAARLQAGKEPAAVDPARQAAAAAAPQDFNTAVRSEAQRLRLVDDRTAIIEAGHKAFGKAAFDEAANVVAAVGCVSDDFVSDVLAVDRTRAHEIYAKLAEDPEKAASLSAMDTRRRIAELTRMADALAPKIDPGAPAAPKPPAVPPKQVSKAPAPPPPVDPSASKTVDWRSDEADDATFSKGWEDNIAKRANTRR